MILHRPRHQLEILVQQPDELRAGQDLAGRGEIAQIAEPDGGGDGLALAPPDRPGQDPGARRGSEIDRQQALQQARAATRESVQAASAGRSSRIVAIWASLKPLGWRVAQVEDWRMPARLLQRGHQIVGQPLGPELGQDRVIVVGGIARQAPAQRLAGLIDRCAAGWSPSPDSIVS